MGQIAENTKGIRELMSSKIITVNILDSLQRVEELFISNDFHHLLVLDDEELVGIISKGDLLIMKDWRSLTQLREGATINREVLRSHFAQDIMNSRLITVDVEMQISDVAELMTEHRINAFPVLENKKLVGIITSYDLIKILF